MDVFITHISTACVLLEIGTVRILTDPVFDQGPARYSFGAPGIGATRFLGPSINSDEVGEVDVLLLSHPHHLDNFDYSGRKFLGRAREIITGHHGKKTLKGHATGLRDWNTTTIFGRAGEQITVTATPALHGPRWLPFTRHVCGFVLEWKQPKPRALYLSGDTIYCDELREIANRFVIDTAILHLGAVHFWPPFPKFLRFTFNAREAVQMAELLRPRQVIPIHYEQSVWSHFKEDVATYHRVFRDAGLLEKLRWLPKGVRVSLA